MYSCYKGGKLAQTVFCIRWWRCWFLLKSWISWLLFIFSHKGCHLCETYLSLFFCVPLQVDVTKCVVSTDPNFCSHWLVSAVCAFGHYLKTVVLHLLREKWKKKRHSGLWAHCPALHTTNTTKAPTALEYVYTYLHWASSMNTHPFHRQRTFLASLASPCLFIINGYIMAHIGCKRIKTASVSKFSFSFFIKLHSFQSWCLFCRYLAAPSGTKW